MKKNDTRREFERLDTQLSLLADSERRAIITHLQNSGSDTTTLDALVNVLAPHSSVERDHARIRLHHSHLPKLAETPLISYDPDLNVVEYHRHPELEALLDAIPETRLQNTEP